MDCWYDTLREMQRSLLFQWIWDSMDQESPGQDQEILIEETKGTSNCGKMKVTTQGLGIEKF